MSQNGMQPPRQTRGLVLIGLLTTLIGFGGFLGWAALTPLDSAVIAPGTIKVGSERKRIQHLEGGLLKSINIREGQDVRAGDLLFSLDETFAQSQHGVLEQQLKALEIRESVLRAEQAGLDKLTFEPALMEDASPALQQRLSEALSQFTLNRAALDNRLAILNRQALQLQEQAQGVQSEIRARQNQLAFTRDEIDSLQKLIDKKMAGKGRYLELQRDGAELQGIIAQLKTRAASLRTQQSELELEGVQTRQTYHYAAAEELRKVRDEAAKIREQMMSTRHRLARIEIRAPVDGTVVNLGIFTPGEVIQPGDTLAEIVPHRDELLISTRIMPVDVDQVSSGQTARVRIASFKPHEMPELLARVESVSADALYDESLQTRFYEARIALTVENRELIRKLQPGMPAEAYILTGRSTPLQYLAEPLLNAFARAWRED